MKPFDLQRAIAGDPLVTRGGITARFVAHVPECDHSYRVIAIVEGDGATTAYGEDGRMWRGEDRHYDLMMAPKKRTVWVNLYRRGACTEAAWHDAESIAHLMTEGCEDLLVARAVPIEIEL